jgi:hypothetical protein
MAKKNNIFFEVFCGEFCEIVTNLEVTNTINIGDDGHTHDTRMPLTLGGFLMDVDDEYIYLSDDGENVNQAFPKCDLKNIRIVDINAEVDNMLDSIPEPDKGGYN